MKVLQPNSTFVYIYTFSGFEKDQPQKEVFEETETLEGQNVAGQKVQEPQWVS